MSTGGRVSPEGRHQGTTGVISDVCLPLCNIHCTHFSTAQAGREGTGGIMHGKGEVCRCSHQCSWHSVFRASQRHMPPAFQGKPRKQSASRFTSVMRLQVAAGWGTARGADDSNRIGAGCGPGCRCSIGCAIAVGALMLCAPIAAAGLSGTVSRPGCQTPWAQIYRLPQKGSHEGSIATGLETPYWYISARTM